MSKSHSPFLRLLPLLALLLAGGTPDAPRKTVVCWGDSLTAPHGQSLSEKDDSYPACLQRLLGDEYQIVNCGVGGENTLTIMARQGASPMRLAHDVEVYQDGRRAFRKFLGNGDVTAFVSSGDSTRRVTPLLQGGWQDGTAAWVNPVRLDSLGFEIESESKFWLEDGHYVFEYNYFISSLQPLERTVRLKKGTILETRAMRELRGAYANIFFMGENGGFRTVQELIGQLRDMVSYSRSHRYLVVSFHKPNAVIPTISRMREMEDSLEAAFGTHYVNLRAYLVDHGLGEAGLRPSAVDRDSMARGQVPPQILTDGVHFTSDGYQVIAGLLERRLRSLGY